jgi:hypothetical protein
MSAYNQAQYNQTKFNIEVERIPRFNLNLIERVTAVSASGAWYMFIAVLSERVTSEAEVAKGFIITGSGGEIITLEAAGNRYFRLIAGGFEELQHKSNISAVHIPRANLSESVTASGVVSEYIRFVSALFETLTHAGTIGQRVILSRDLNEMVDVIADVEATEEHVCSLNITIRPGQTLIVDAANYNIFLDGENIVYAHSGDWIDEMNRMTQSIKITGTRAANLSASILFTEQYL